MPPFLLFRFAVQSFRFLVFRFEIARFAILFGA
jgi:hypothetical protein